MWILQGNNILSEMEFVSRRTAHSVFICVLFELNVVQQVLASLDTFRKVDISSRSNSDDMGMLAEGFEGYRVMIFSSRFT